MPTKTRRKRRFHCHILQEFLWRIFIRIDFYTIRQKKQKKHLFEMGETCHKLFFVYPRAICFPSPRYFFLSIVSCYIFSLFNIWAHVRWDGEIFLHLFKYHEVVFVMQTEFLCSIKLLLKIKYKSDNPLLNCCN